MGDLKKDLLKDLSKNEKSLLNSNVNGKELLDDQLDGVAGGSSKVPSEFAFWEGDEVTYNNSRYIIVGIESRDPRCIVYTICPAGERHGRVSADQDELLRYNQPTQNTYRSSRCRPGW